MSTEATLELRMLGYWHPGTGRGDGVGADAVVHRDAVGLPVLPGRTVKGLLRHAGELGAAARIPGLDEPTVQAIFGTRLAIRALPGGDGRVAALEEKRFGTRAGALRVSSAGLGVDDRARAAWHDLARSEEAVRLLSTLRTTLSSTAIDEDGLARDHTLRTVEVWVPVVLYAPLAWDPGLADGVTAPWEPLDQAVRLFLRALGSGRNRGLGRCAARVHSGSPR